jgi:hypothetical protein
LIGISFNTSEDFRVISYSLSHRIFCVRIPSDIRGTFCIDTDSELKIKTGMTAGTYIEISWDTGSAFLKVTGWRII